jgi:hypothetical protein
VRLWLTSFRLLLLAVLALGVTAQPLMAWTRLACIPGAICAIDGSPGPACRPCCHPARDVPVLRANCCIVHQGVSNELRAESHAVVLAVLHAPLPALISIDANPPSIHRMADVDSWTPPWVISPEQGGGARPPPIC